MALQRPARLLRFDQLIDNKGLTRIRVWSNCRKMRVFRDHESETGKVPLGLIPYVRHGPTKLHLPQPPLTLAEGAGSNTPLAST